MHKIIFQNQFNQFLYNKKTPKTFNKVLDDLYCRDIFPHKPIDGVRQDIFLLCKNKKISYQVYE